jgi:hypothetical protein
MRSGSLREQLLATYGPLFLPVLFVVWAMFLVLGFALLQWAAGLQVGQEKLSFMDTWFFSGGTLLSFASDKPASSVSRLLTGLEAAAGLGFIALLISYLPVLYQGFSRRESRLYTMDSRASSPPSALMLLSREGRRPEKLDELLGKLEEWCADLFETHLSYPALAYFRSHHNNQSWLSAVTTILDTSAAVMAAHREHTECQARHTFAIARHLLVDLSTVFRIPPQPTILKRRLSDDELKALKTVLLHRKLAVYIDSGFDQRLAKLRSLYEPYAMGLSDNFLVALPAWTPKDPRENWRATSWGATAAPFSVSNPYERGSDAA